MLERMRLEAQRCTVDEDYLLYVVARFCALSPSVRECVDTMAKLGSRFQTF